jgi:ectoine hydroxylase-related dioxygenase (phytanoyl-CoA dioxygenase family)
VATITPEHVRRYHDDGYFILERAVAGAELSRLQERCMAFVERERQAAAAKGLTTHQQAGKFFITFPASRDDEVAQFVFGETMSDLARATVGDEAVLFYDQFVVKGPERGQSFAWHQDSGYVAFPHRPYVTCWVALDDMSAANGTVSILPYARAGTRTRVEHVRDEATRDLVGYHGDDPGELVTAPAGSIAVFSSTVFHRSGVNTTPNYRRVYVVQYAPQRMVRPDGTQASRADPVLRNGKRCGPPAPI